MWKYSCYSLEMCVTIKVLHKRIPYPVLQKYIMTLAVTDCTGHINFSLLVSLRAQYLYHILFTHAYLSLNEPHFSIPTIFYFYLFYHFFPVKLFFTDSLPRADNLHFFLSLFLPGRSQLYAIKCRVSSLGGDVAGVVLCELSRYYCFQVNRFHSQSKSLLVAYLSSASSCLQLSEGRCLSVCFNLLGWLQINTFYKHRKMVKINKVEAGTDIQAWAPTRTHLNLQERELERIQLY